MGSYGGNRGGGGRQQYDNNLSGALFQNDRQEKDGDPDMKGSCEVDGVEYWVAAWWNKTKDGVEYLKFKLNPKDANGGRGQQQRQPYGQGNRPGNSRGPGARVNPGRRGPNSDQRDDDTRSFNQNRGRGPNSDQRDDRGGPDNGHRDDRGGYQNSSDMDDDIPF